MSTTLAAPPELETMADVLRQLGGISPRRIRMTPTPGTATFADVEHAHLCELIDGTLVEKTMGIEESALAALLIRSLLNFVLPAKLGAVTAPDGTYRLMPNIVRAPDVAFTSRARLRLRTKRKAAVAEQAPDLAIEVLSKGNTRAEMARKRREFFAAGVRCVWELDPKKRSARVYAAPDDFVTLTLADTLDGGDILPGFRLPLLQLFRDLDESDIS